MSEITVQRLLEEFEANEKETPKYSTTTKFFKFIHPITWHGKSYRTEIGRDGKSSFAIRITRGKQK